MVAPSWWSFGGTLFGACFVSAFLWRTKYVVPALQCHHVTCCSWTCTCRHDSTNGTSRILAAMLIIFLICVLGAAALQGGYVPPVFDAVAKKVTQRALMQRLHEYKDTIVFLPLLVTFLSLFVSSMRSLLAQRVVVEE
eukprot:m.94365 g.94365  ORF g.94365 m.94365 type:complete len:138 (-) comp12236_c0_seq2:187-600(-)